ncbi:GH12338 [Drosophila grimshawi]|uniref:GH12338 n=1 Tax=Drosophila grimshawi TaxID=7222 RepID=B4K156_DROGR|nr:GH12338 [Drosophila grimshawi]
MQSKLLRLNDKAEVLILPLLSLAATVAEVEMETEVEAETVTETEAATLLKLCCRITT